MKVYIAVDLEGISGLTEVAEMDPPGHDHDAARRLMAADANAAVAGAIDGGAEEVVVCDAHSGATTLRIEDLDPRAELIRGRTKPGRMVHGLDGSAGALLCVGFHARAGASDGVLNHTWLGKELHDAWLNGEPAGELRLLAALAGHHGVPVVLVTGDDACGEEARALLPGVRTVRTKTAIDRFAARLRAPSAVAADIREEARLAVAGAAQARPYRVATPATIEVEWNSTSIAAQCALVPGVERTGPRRTAFEGADVPAAYRAFVVMGMLAGLAGDRVPYG